MATVCLLLFDNPPQLRHSRNASSKDTNMTSLPTLQECEKLKFDLQTLANKFNAQTGQNFGSSIMLMIFIVVWFFSIKNLSGPVRAPVRAPVKNVVKSAANDDVKSASNDDVVKSVKDADKSDQNFGKIMQNFNPPKTIWCLFYYNDGKKEQIKKLMENMLRNSKHVLERADIISYGGEDEEMIKYSRHNEKEQKKKEQEEKEQEEKELREFEELKPKIKTLYENCKKTEDPERVALVNYDSNLVNINQLYIERFINGELTPDSIKQESQNIEFQKKFDEKTSPPKTLPPKTSPLKTSPLKT